MPLHYCMQVCDCDAMSVHTDLHSATAAALHQIADMCWLITGSNERLYVVMAQLFQLYTTMNRHNEQTSYAIGCVVFGHWSKPTQCEIWRLFWTLVDCEALWFRNRATYPNTSLILETTPNLVYIGPQTLRIRLDKIMSENRAQFSP